MRRRGFTLVELLVVILIIGILGGLLYSAVQRAAGVSKIVHTKSTIAKLNASLMDRWDSYRNRRLPLDAKAVLSTVESTNGAAYPAMQSAISAMSARRVSASGGSLHTYPTKPYDPLSVPPNTLVQVGTNPNGTPIMADIYVNREMMAAVRLLAMRELMKFEMPQHFDEFIGNFSASTSPGGFALRGTNILPAAPAVAQSYLAAVNAASINGASFAQIKANDSAECLYMILTLGSTDSGLFGEQAPNSDIGDVDGDGLLEFQDAWPVAMNSFTPKGQGNSPIDFLRWAPGFISDVQDNPTIPNVVEFSAGNHDFFDPLKLDVPGGPSQPPRGFRLIPLIYSAGPNGLWSLDYGPPNMDDPYDATGLLAGTPSPGWEDNVNNHDLDTMTGK